MDTVRFVAEVDVDGYARAGIADFQGGLHLFVSECLDWEDEQRSRRMGETFFLLPIPDEAAAEATLREQAELTILDDDPQWQQKHAQRWARWFAFKQPLVQAAQWAWHARGNFRTVQRRRKNPVSFRWTLLSGERVSGEAVRCRLAKLDELARDRSGTGTGGNSGSELSF